MGLGHWIMDHFWLVAMASLLAMFGVHMAITRLLRAARSQPE